MPGPVAIDTREPQDGTKLVGFMRPRIIPDQAVDC
jgi:hypothetical protein